MLLKCDLRPAQTRSTGRSGVSTRCGVWAKAAIRAVASPALCARSPDHTQGLAWQRQLSSPSWVSVTIMLMWSTTYRISFRTSNSRRLLTTTRFLSFSHVSASNNNNTWDYLCETWMRNNDNSCHRNKETTSIQIQLSTDRSLMLKTQTSNTILRNVTHFIKWEVVWFLIASRNWRIVTLRLPLLLHSEDLCLTFLSESAEGLTFKSRDIRVSIKDKSITR